MKFIFLTFALLCGHLNAQTTVLDESFETGVFPPIGWEEMNNGNNLGWEDSLVGSAFHDDYVGVSNNRLVTLSMDLTSLTQIYLHLKHSSQWTDYRLHNLIEISLDSGLSFQPLRRIRKTGDFENALLNSDLSQYAGLADVRIAFRYVGDFANEWSLEKVRVDDVDPSTAVLWPNIPTAPILADGFVEDFENLAGQVPTYMALNSLDNVMRNFDSNSWCNIGQLGANLHANGLYSLEMGVAPGYAFEEYYSNSMVLYLDGTNAGRLWMEMSVMNHGEEWTSDDGVFFSTDGVSWNPLLEDWDQATGGLENIGTWQDVRVQISGAGANTTGLFYLAISESDNRAYGQSDGLAIDDIRICSKPVLEAFGDGPGFHGGVRINDCQSDSLVTLLYSKVGPGPTQSSYGILELSLPIFNFGTYTPDVTGQVIVGGTVPTWLTGMSVWTQAVMSWEGLSMASNSLALQF